MMCQSSVILALIIAMTSCTTNGTTKANKKIVINRPAHPVITSHEQYFSKLNVFHDARPFKDSLFTVGISGKQSNDENITIVLKKVRATKPYYSMYIIKGNYIFA